MYNYIGDDHVAYERTFRDKYMAKETTESLLTTRRNTGALTYQGPAG